MQLFLYKFHINLTHEDSVCYWKEHLLHTNCLHVMIVVKEKRGIYELSKLNIMAMPSFMFMAKYFNIPYIQKKISCVN